MELRGKLTESQLRSLHHRLPRLANGKNPISIVIPCHRVIGADGSLTGFGGGLHRKQALLELEGSITPNFF